jgi:hypothetical protein
MFLVGQQEICLILVLFVIGNMVSILKVNENMGHVHLHPGQSFFMNRCDLLM